MKPSLILVAAMVLVLVAPTCLAIGIAPGEVKTTSGTSKDFKFLIINNEGLDLYAKLGVEPFYEGKTKYSEMDVHLLPTEKEKEFKVRLDIPSSVKCGIVAKVYAEETVQNINGNSMTGKVMSRIVVTECNSPFLSWLVPTLVLGLIAVTLAVGGIYLYTHKPKFIGEN